MTTIEARHRSEVDSGDRFEFGKNWSRFLSNLTVARIELAEKSLQAFLQSSRLDGKSFLDVGSGSGLFSLAARRLGARVHSFDYDTNSVACTRELRRRYFQDDPAWTVEQGSVLDADYLRALGTFDIVYSWGVLHHTGSMWQALENVKPLVPVGGQLFIAIYNDQGEPTDHWARIKKSYNALPRPLALLFALGIITKEETREFTHHYRRGAPREWLRTWTEYDKISTRGMSRWHDWIDWIGGHPYERATVEQIVEVFARDGFRLSKLLDRSTGYGCNEFVFNREAAAGQFIDARLPGGRSIGRQFGSRVVGPFELTEAGWAGVVNDPPELADGAPVYLLRDDQIIGTVSLSSDSRVVVGPREDSLESVGRHAFYVVSAIERTMEPPFVRVRGRMWDQAAPDLLQLADHEGDAKRSPAFVFEDNKQLSYPHAIHNDIDRYGAGRFSHWGPSVYFSSTDGTDPNSRAHAYRLLVATRLASRDPAKALAPPAAAPQSMARQFGWPIVGPFERSDAGWTGVIANASVLPNGPELQLIEDDQLRGPVIPDAVGRVLVARPEASEQQVRAAAFNVVPGSKRVLAGPFMHERGFMWVTSVPDLESISDGVGHDQRSPVFVFESGRQLDYPHTPHDHIGWYGKGRFAHWNNSIYISAIDNTNPNTNGRTYELVDPRLALR